MLITLLNFLYIQNVRQAFKNAFLPKIPPKLPPIQFPEGFKFSDIRKILDKEEVDPMRQTQFHQTLLTEWKLVFDSIETE